MSYMMSDESLEGIAKMCGTKGNKWALLLPKHTQRIFSSTVTILLNILIKQHHL